MIHSNTCADICKIQNIVSFHTAWAKAPEWRRPTSRPACRGVQDATRAPGGVLTLTHLGDGVQHQEQHVGAAGPLHKSHYGT